MLRIAIIFNRFGPYHYARLKAAGRINEIFGIELCANDDVYKWEVINNIEGFEKITLFKDKDIIYQPFKLIQEKIENVIDRIKPDVLALNGYTERGILATLSFALKEEIPVVLMSDSNAYDFNRNYFREKIKKRIVSMYSAGLASGKSATDYLANLGLPTRSIFTGLDVVDNEYFRRSAKDARKKVNEIRKKLLLPENYFLAINRFIPKKNIISLLEAYSKYIKLTKNNVWGLVLIGDGPQRNYIEQKIKDLKLTDQVILPGFMQYDELPVYYGLANVFIHFSKREQWGLVVNEAMAAGLPVIVSDRCGCSYDLVKEGGNGFRVNPFKIESLVSIMLRISYSDFNIKLLGKKSLEIISNWTPNTFADSIDKAAKAALVAPKHRMSIINKLILNIAMRRKIKLAVFS